MENITMGGIGFVTPTNEQMIIGHTTPYWHKQHVQTMNIIWNIVKF